MKPARLGLALGAELAALDGVLGREDRGVLEEPPELGQVRALGPVPGDEALAGRGVIVAARDREGVLARNGALDHPGPVRVPGAVAFAHYERGWCGGWG